jgi:hypothetical protein
MGRDSEFEGNGANLVGGAAVGALARQIQIAGKLRSLAQIKTIM